MELGVNSSRLTTKTDDISMREQSTNYTAKEAALKTKIYNMHI
jgi:hypothetical protein